MGDRSSIEWTDATWNPLRGCTRVSEGCRHCYAERVAARFSTEPLAPYFGVANAKGWTGKVVLVEEHLADPLRWRRPRRVFVNSMSDLFHEKVPDEWIAQIFAVMALADRHTYQVLTKRAGRPPRLLEDRAFWTRAMQFAEAYAEQVERVSPGGMMGFDAWADGVIADRRLPNVWLGVSVEDQATADARIEPLMATPAAVRFVSYEPALGPVDFDLIDGFRVGERCGVSPDGVALGPLHWIIVGGESGPGARPFDVAWARSTIAQCRAAGVPCFVKQLGAEPRETAREGSACHLDDWPGDWEESEGWAPQRAGVAPGGGQWWAMPLHDRKGGDIAEWPADLRVREFPATGAAP